jgi:hypothetical protein
MMSNAKNAEKEWAILAIGLRSYRFYELGRVQASSKVKAKQKALDTGLVTWQTIGDIIDVTSAEYTKFVQDQN